MFPPFCGFRSRCSQLDKQEESSQNLNRYLRKGWNTHTHTLILFLWQTWQIAHYHLWNPLVSFRPTSQVFKADEPYVPFCSDNDFKSKAKTAENGIAFQEFGYCICAFDSTYACRFCFDFYSFCFQFGGHFRSQSLLAPRRRCVQRAVSPGPAW